MDKVEMSEISIKERVSAIVMFGPATPTSGMRPAEYYQVVIDPNMKSPMGNFIRFDQTIQGGEMHGWQRVDALTVCEILGNAPEYKENPAGYTVDINAVVKLRAVV